MKQEKGISLVELLAVIVIVGIIAVIAVPYLMSSKKSTNEQTAVASVRSIQLAQTTFISASGTLRFGTFDDLRGENLLDSSYSGASIVRNNYLIELSITSSSSALPGYCIKASPQTAAAGSKYYGANQRNLIYESTVAADIACAAGVLTLSGGAVLSSN